MRRDRVEGAALVAVSAASFGVMPVLTKVVYRDGADVAAVLAVRFSVAGALLVAVVAAVPALRARLPARRDAGALALLGGVGYVGQSAGYFTALTYASAGLVALLLYAYPFLVVALAALLLRHPVSRTGLACLVAAVAGTALTIGPAARGGQALGVVLGLGAALCYSLYILAGSRVVPRVDPVVATAVVMSSAALVYVVVAAATGARLPSAAGAWVALVAVALVSTVVASVTFFAGLRRLGPADASVISTLEPVVSVALAALVLGEALTPVQLAGGVVVLAAVTVLTRRPAEGAGAGRVRRRRSEPRVPA